MPLFLVSKWGPSAKKYDLFPPVASKCYPVLRRTIYWRCLWVRSGGLSAQKYDLLPLFVVSKCCPSAKKYDLLPLFVISEWFFSAKKYDFAVVCGFEVVLQC